MTPAPRAPLIARVHDFWFGTPVGPERPEWFGKDVAFDTAIRTTFAGDVAAALAGAHDGLARSPEGAVTLCILLDQFPRNIWRGSARAYAGDAKARDVARAAIGDGLHRGLAPVQKLFLFLPFEHSEDLADQDLAVELFRRETGHAGWIRYAQAHRDIIARFGRFPHRNAVLGRASTAEEEAFLREPGSTF